MQKMTTDERTGTTDRRRNDRRAEIVRCAIDAMRHRGATAATTGLVCTCAGVTKGVFAHHFPGGKDELLAAAVETASADIGNLINHALQRHGTAGAISAFFDFYADMVDDDPSFGCPIAGVIVDHVDGEVDDSLRTGTAHALMSWARLVTDALRADGLAPDDAEQLAIAVISSMEGAIILSTAHGNGHALRATGRVMADMVRLRSGS
jgi:TetR/AcrR family transcriptional regulator, lmrAB and yxaGH operons repressor